MGRSCKAIPCIWLLLGGQWWPCRLLSREVQGSDLGFSRITLVVAMRRAWEPRVGSTGEMVCVYVWP